MKPESAIPLLLSMPLPVRAAVLELPQLIRVIRVQNVNRDPPHRTQSAGAVNNQRPTPSSARSRSSPSYASAAHSTPVNTARARAAANPAVRRGSGNKRRQSTSSPASRKRAHVEDVTNISDDVDDIPLQRTPSSRTPVSAVRVNTADGAAGVRAVHIPQSLQGRFTSVTVAPDNFIQVNVGGLPVDTDDQRLAEEYIEDEAMQQSFSASDAVYMEWVREHAKGCKKIIHMPDEYYDHCYRHIEDPQYLVTRSTCQRYRAQVDSKILPEPSPWYYAARPDRRRRHWSRNMFS